MLFNGARIGVISPAGLADPDRVAKGMAMARSWGLDLVAAPNLGRQHRYYAGTMPERRADLIWALSEPTLDAVWYARGGYGSVQLVDVLASLEPSRRPVIGFSDATALFSAMLKQGWGRPVHGPVLHSLADHADEASQQALRALLVQGEQQTLTGRHLCGPAGEVSGTLVGGNLCVLASLAGTPWALDSGGGILLLEDVGEPPYKVDRLLTQLHKSGGFRGVQGIALGRFHGSQPPEGADWTLEDVLRDALAHLGVPVVCGLQIGHGTANHAVVLGAPYRLNGSGLHAD